MKILKYKTIGIFFLLWTLMFTEVFAQMTYRIEGRVVNETSENLSAASIALWAMDSTFVEGTVSDHKGFFQLKNVKGGNFFLKVSMLGYEPASIPLEDIRGNLNLRNLTLKQSITELKGVTIKGASLVRQVDRMLVFPDKDAVRHSFNPYELLSNMAIPGLTIDKITKTIEADNGTVQIRINGVKATKEDYLALSPKDILRIEVIDNPGMRYGEDIGTVIDLIVKRRPYGGQITTSVESQVNELAVYPYVNVKLNYKRSQFGVRYNAALLNYTKGDMTSDEQFHLGNQDIHRLQVGEKYQYNNLIHVLNLSYNLSSPDDYQLNVLFYNSWNYQPHEDRTTRLSNAGSTDFILGETTQTRRSYVPTLDIYFRKQFRKKQELQVNVIGTILPVKTGRRYKEIQQDGTALSDIWTNVDANKKSVWTEAFYGKTFRKMVLNAGIRHYQMYARNEYTGNNFPTVSRMQQMNSSAFVDLQGKWKGIGYLFSIGGTRSYFKEGESHAYYTFTPVLRVNFVPHKNGWLQYTFTIKPNIPSLSSLTDVEQMIDTIQIQRGNPSLQTYRQYTNTLNYSYVKGIFSLSTYLKHQYSANPIMEEYFVENGKLIRTEENQEYWQKAEWGTTIGLRNIKAGDWRFSLYLTTWLTRYWSKGKLYSYTHNRFYYSPSANISYKEWGFTWYYTHGKGDFTGETISRYNNNMIFGLTYEKNNFSVMAYLQNPFKTVRWGYERLSRVAPMKEWNYNRDVTRALSLSISYRFEFGQKFKNREHSSSYSDTDSGILK